MTSYQDSSKRRSFIVTVPSWKSGGKDVTLKLLRQAIEDSGCFGMAETRAEKVVIKSAPKEGYRPLLSGD